jgi:hypothetical protein
LSRIRKTTLTGEQIASGLIPSSLVKGEDEVDTGLLRKMSQVATEYTSSFSWCDAVRESHFGGGVGGIFAVFFFRIRSTHPDVDPWIWIMVGDIPPAYLPLSDCESPAEAIRSYIHGMARWVEMARSGGASTPSLDIPPVNLPATPEWAERLNQKLYGLTLAVGPYFDESDEAPGRLQ